MLNADRGGETGSHTGADRVPHTRDLRVPHGGHKAEGLHECRKGRPGIQGVRILRQARRQLYRDEVAKEATLQSQSLLVLQGNYSAEL